VELGQAPFALAASGSAWSSRRATSGAFARSTRRRGLRPALHRGPRGRGRGRGGAVRKAGPVGRAFAGDRRGHQRETPAATAPRVLACSSPTGPAFEGAQISAGPARGARSHRAGGDRPRRPRSRASGDRLDLWSDEPGLCRGRGGTGVTGICGSGHHRGRGRDAMAGLLDAGGLIGRPSRRDALGWSRRGDPCLPAPRRHGGAGPRSCVTQGRHPGDPARQVGASMRGARLLMDEMGVDRWTG
jgi:hypothetical protein